MGVLVAASFSISRILYLLDIYYTPSELGCQVNVNHRFHRFSQILWIELPAEATEGTENTEKKKFEIISTKCETNSKPRCSNDQNGKESRGTEIIRIWV
jgi:hypothetical protein